MKTQKKRVVIIGGGFGGTYTARYLFSLVKKGLIELTLINQTNYFLFTPLLHEVASGGLSPTNVAEPLREVFNNPGIRFVKARVESIDSIMKIVHCGDHTFPYDYLVCAVGAETAFYNVPGAKEHSFTLKNLAEAMEIRYKTIDLFEEASNIEDKALREKKLSFVIVGGGATGVEYAAELAEFAYETLYRFYAKKSLCRDDISITLISIDSELITQFHPKLRQKALRILNKKGVRVLLNTSVTSVEENSITLNNKTNLEASMTVWLAGVTPLFPTLDSGLSLHSSKRLDVDEFLRATKTQNIFVLGDAAASRPPEMQNKPLPMLAQVAVVQAKIVAHNIRASIEGVPLKTFHYKPLGSLISVGQWMALGDLFGLQISGPHIWWLWRTVYLFKFHAWRKRFKIAFEWTVNLFYPRDVTKVL